jgi:hypothetical protein
LLQYQYTIFDQGIIKFLFDRPVFYLLFGIFKKTKNESNIIS